MHSSYGKAIPHAIVGLLAWLFVCAVWLPLFIIGLPLVGWLSFMHAWYPAKSQRFEKHEHIDVWELDWVDRIWGNDEDGVTGDARWWPTYCDARGWKSQAFRAWMWSAIRNPVNNFRFTKLVDFGFEPERLRYVGNSDDCAVDLDRYRRGELNHRTFWFFAWHGMYPAFWLIQVRDNTTHTRIRLGWKFTPAFRNGIPTTDYRYHSEAFTPAQFGWRRNG